MPRTVHSYLRFSTPEQALGDSERRQTEAAEKFCERHKFKLSDLRFSDLGKSSFRGNKQKALLAFLSSMSDPNDSRIKPGDILLVENIDRLSRKVVLDTQELVIRIFRAGIDIAILSPQEKIYSAKTYTLMDAMEIAMYAHAANTYSQNLRQRGSAYFVKARRDAYATGKPINSGPFPSWVRRTPDGFKPISEAVKLIRHIFGRVIEGASVRGIMSELNGKGIEPISLNWMARQTETTKRMRAKASWNQTYIRLLIKDRRVLGEFQPRITGDDGKMDSEGLQPIPNYYPAIIDEETYLQAKAAIENRKMEKGSSIEYINLFTGLVHHAADKCPCVLHTYKVIKADGQRLVFRRLRSKKVALCIKGASIPTVDLAHFERHIIKHLREIDLSIFVGNKSAALDLAALTARLNDRKNRLTKLQDQSAEKGDLDLLLPSMRKIQSEIDDLAAQVEQSKTAQRNLTADSLDKIKHLSASKFADTNENRVKLREAIKRVVKRIDILPVKLGKLRRSPVACVGQLMLANGNIRSLMFVGDKSASHLMPAERRDKPLADYTPKEIKWLAGVAKHGIEKEYFGLV